MEDLKVRLDSWHYLRRLASNYQTDSHQLYGPFMASLSAALFAWDADDLQLLRTAKKAEMVGERLSAVSDDDVKAAITR